MRKGRINGIISAIIVVFRPVIKLISAAKSGNPGLDAGSNPELSPV